MKASYKPKIRCASYFSGLLEQGRGSTVSPGFHVEEQECVL